jgi:hypothetical protein
MKKVKIFIGQSAKRVDDFCVLCFSLLAGFTLMMILIELFFQAILLIIKIGKTQW